MANPSEVDAAKNDKPTHIIAIDFGTSGSGIAVWNNALSETFVYSNWRTKNAGVVCKCPTVLLLDHEGKLERFGFDAEKYYQSKRSIANPEKADEYYLFKNFKMCLYEEMNLVRSLMVEAANGKKLPAHDVFAKSLIYLKQEITGWLDRQIAVPSRRIQWILTVPAIWSPGAKQMMREAAMQAGLGVEAGSTLKLVLEPEAAAMFCQKELSSIGTLQDSTALSKPVHYLVVDCGGGTLDMAAHKLTKSADGKITIEEIHQAHGGPYGGFAVNVEFEKLLKALFQLSNEDMEKIKKQHSRPWTKLIYEDFEGNKCSDQVHTEITTGIHKNILKEVKAITGKNIEDLVAEYKRHEVQWDDEEEGLVIQSDVIYSLFLPVITHIIAAIDQVLKKPECQYIEKILLVGGFAASNYLYDEVKRTFSPSKIVEVSSTPSLAVLKGAVLYGLHQDMIKSRVMSQSIGIETWDDFESGIHDEKRKATINGKDFCKNVFTKFVDINESVSIDKNIEHVFTPSSIDQDNCKVRIIASHSAKAAFTDEDCCYELGLITVEGLPKYNSGISREVRVVINVSGTEVVVDAYCNGTSKKLPVKLDFIEDK